MPKIQNTLVPYEEIPYEGIQYCNCRDYDHISRHRGLRQVIHSPESSDRFSALETTNPFSSYCDVIYYDVTANFENRLDLIAYKFLGSPTYAWVISLFNNLEDGFTVREGQRLAIPKSVSSLFSKGELLAPISALQLNLGTE